jgi:hypothetical protein
VQRLAQVVAGGGEELRLGAAGGFGGAAGASAAAISTRSCSRQLVGARLQRDGLAERAAVGARPSAP